MKALITAGTTAAAFSRARALVGQAVLFGDNARSPVPTVLKDKFVTIPAPETETFLHELLTLCLDLEVTDLYPLRPDEQEALRLSVQLFAEFGVEIHGV